MPVDYPAALWRPSPNFRPRGPGERVRLVVVHGTWMAGDAAALARLCDAAAEVSCHYYISRAGEVTQLVSEADVAWHAGQSRWEIDGEVVEGLNPFSLGIELANSGPFQAYPDGPPREVEAGPVDWTRAEPYTEAQYAALGALLGDILPRYGLDARAVVGHDAVAPGRKRDPGAHFDWARVRRALAFSA
jgi:N-acetylmuramoyl-L-alanine amidase